MRPVRIILSFWRAAIAAELEYRTNFVLSLLTAVGGLVGGVFGLSLFYSGGHTFKGWAFEQSLLVLGCFTVLSGLVQTLLNPNLSRIVDHVENGTLDFVLLKPVDSQLWVSLRHFSPWGLPDLLLGVGVLVYAGAKSNLYALDLVVGLVALGFGAIMLYGLWFMVAATSIWFVKVYNATEVLRGLLDAGRYPMAAYPGAYRVFFTFVVPVAFLTTVPARAFLGRDAGTQVMVAGVLAVASVGAARAFWRYALRSYTSASS